MNSSGTRLLNNNKTKKCPPQARPRQVALTLLFSTSGAYAYASHAVMVLCATCATTRWNRSIPNPTVCEDNNLIYD